MGSEFSTSKAATRTPRYLILGPLVRLLFDGGGENIES